MHFLFQPLQSRFDIARAVGLVVELRKQILLTGTVESLYVLGDVLNALADVVPPLTLGGFR
ncbi:hypothetical protein [Haloarcula sp. 1CSR25-25]|uniref:hypothetical protein n=1 Tax=Haloarcula sp. 1CSR25-25 TaxID=2862545 RepID=UPI00289495F8|nr:hypothetical protein [Haloarcula sp. 1CSR25-25]MDT3437618.1 hypothetical protein [Haloarcula sp. 1CSR25-25]